ncbi:MAG: glycerophosphodiester phosphodiesterase [Clostridia bacterium]|nr:glycerophosphodiester phosphodiesterase [Clostridia bacterium]
MLGFIIFLIILFLALLYLFLISPRLKDRADMDMLLVDYAHRGLWNEQYPENSLPAFARAAESGFGIELDIQLTKDKRIVVFHDYDLVRMCGAEKKISELTYRELCEYRLGGSAFGIPTLAEVLKLVDGRVPLLIELKGEDSDTELCKRAVSLLDKYQGAFSVESFNPLLLQWFKKYRPRYARGQLVTKVTKKTRKGSAIVGFALSNLLLNLLSRPDFIAVDGKIRKRPMIFICERLFGAKIFVWTVRNRRAYETCQRDERHSIFEKFIP